jgi:hypothetical protein
MQAKHAGGSHSRRILLVGLTPLTMRAFEGPLSDSASVSAVPFPSAAFESVLDDMRPQLVVVDVTYLDEARVRPMLMGRLSEQGTTLAFVAEGGYGWYDDLASGRSGPMEDAGPEALLALIARPALEVVG